MSRRPGDPPVAAGARCERSRPTPGRPTSGVVVLSRPFRRSPRGTGHAHGRCRHQADRSRGLAPAARAAPELSRAPRRRLPGRALVSAPAGYGKTATLASWAHGRAEDRVAWLSCDPPRTPSRRGSCRVCCAAISARGRGAPTTPSCCWSRRAPTPTTRRSRWPTSWPRWTARGVIVVDDLHLAAPAPGDAGGVHRCPARRFRFVAGTRSDPPLSLGRLRLRGELLELRGDDLRFGADGDVRLLRSSTTSR